MQLSTRLRGGFGTTRVDIVAGWNYAPLECLLKGRGNAAQRLEANHER